MDLFDSLAGDGFKKTSQPTYRTGRLLWFYSIIPLAKKSTAIADGPALLPTKICQQIWMKIKMKWNRKMKKNQMYVDYMGESKQLIYYYSVKFHLERTHDLCGTSSDLVFSGK